VILLVFRVRPQKSGFSAELPEDTEGNAKGKTKQNTYPSRRVVQICYPNPASISPVKKDAKNSET
jgi:hypothetical protein